MRLVTSTLIEDIEAAIVSAKMRNRRLKEVVLTRAEAAELVRELHSSGMMVFDKTELGEGDQIFGIAIRVE
jgi:hypothetical protein